MEGSYRDKYSFIGEWYDGQACLIRRFNVFYYPVDNTVEMYDLKFRKTFVRRVKVNGISLESFYIGCTVAILGRLIKIVDFACEDTKRLLHKDIQVTFAMIKPLATNIVGKILTHLNENGLRITKMKKTRLTAEDINVLYRSLVGDSTFPFLLEHLSGHLVYGMELVGKEAVSHCLKILGDRDPQKAEPGTIRALYGTDTIRNCVHAPSNPEAALQCKRKTKIIVTFNNDLNSNAFLSNMHLKQDIDYFFPAPPYRAMRLRLTATLSNCTLCIVKPHAIREGKLGAALEIIDEGGFDITALNMFIVEIDNAAEFYEVYKGIVQEYKGMVEELASGPCVAMEIVAKDKSLITAVEFRKLVGPTDPEIARLLRPHTLRAKLGKTKVQNAIHCSDLDVDGLLEVEYFFKILDL